VQAEGASGNVVDSTVTGVSPAGSAPAQEVRPCEVARSPDQGIQVSRRTPRDPMASLRRPGGRPASPPRLTMPRNTLLARTLVVLLIMLLSQGHAGAAAAGCLSCHDGIEQFAQGEMSRWIRERGALSGDPEGCVVCHGGDPNARTEKSAHRGSPAILKKAGGSRGFYPNPGAKQVADLTCGQCHVGYAERWRKSVMSTGAESIELNLCESAWQKRESGGGKAQRFARQEIRDRDGLAPSAGTVAYRSFISALAGAYPEFYPERLHRIPDETVLSADDGPRCRECHGRTAVPSLHGSGCSACHVPYSRNGRYMGGDPTIDRAQPGKLLIHRLQGTGNTLVTVPDGAKQGAQHSLRWSGISPANCFRCHYDPRRLELSAMGSIHSHGVADGSENEANSLACQDCHTSIEMHGDGNIAGAVAAQSEVRCEDCHGTVDKAPWELPLGYGDGLLTQPQPRGVSVSPSPYGQGASGSGKAYLVTSRGNPFGNVFKDGERVILQTASGRAVEVGILKHIKERDAWKSDLARQSKVATDGHRAMACTDCHAERAPPCFGCHSNERDTGMKP